MENKKQCGDNDQEYISVDIQIILAVTRLAKRADDKLVDLKLSSLFELHAIMQGYIKEFCTDFIVKRICAKKIDFIIDAKTKTELKEILSTPKIRYNGNEVIPVGEFHVPEEELLIWSLTSFQAPLNNAGFNRFMKVFKEVLPEGAKLLNLQ